MFDSLAVVGLMADVSCNIIRGREPACDGKGGEEPNGFREKIMVTDRMRDAVRARPGSSW